VIFKPDNPIVEGHLIVAPLVHIENGLLNPVITAQVMRMAAMKAKEPCTIVLPVGEEAGQVHPHMYVHIVPAAAGQARFIKAGEVKARR
jgi:diadenosine tetraphosphate (Ap4A) HIT family hydrolase